MSRNIWRRSLNRRSWEASHNSCADLQVSRSGNRPIHGHLKAIPISFGRVTVFLCPGNPIITPKRILRSQWFHDPWTLGSYSYLAKGCSVQDVENLMEPLPTNRSQAQVPAFSYYKININPNLHLQFFQNSVLPCHFGFLTVDCKQCLIFLCCFFAWGFNFVIFFFFFLIKE